MKKYMILFAVLIGMILVAVEAVPQDRAFSQSPTECHDKAGYVIPCPQNPGEPDKPGPKNKKPVVVTVMIPNLNTPTPTPVPLLYPYPFPYPYLYPTPVPHIPNVEVQYCKFCPIWFNTFLGDPIELLASGGLFIFLVVIGFVFFRSRINLGVKKG
jgi:hypothetical protein